MTTQELETVFNGLRDQTLQKQLKWKAIKTDALRIDFPRSSIMFHKPSGNHPYLAILNSGGSTVATISHGTFNDVNKTLVQLNAMWKAAYEIAYETDETLQDILSRLGPK